ncbi:hypothetical protein Taro_014824 [Colocasia esculenta]|uniref:Uncharacterized protein n=1 Tax=Colocasia esculenta TaxID=4460 RepID=A0A843UFL8_COLES|nr:hypothetical protein [Colocasia esculenta]
MSLPDWAYVAFSVQRQVVLPPLPFSLYCTRGTCASSLVRSHTSRSPGARHLRACPVREVVTVTWDPRPREPVEGVLRATSVLELAATRRTLELRGKRRSSLCLCFTSRVARAVPVALEFARSSGSFLLAGVDRAVSRGVSLGLQGSQEPGASSAAAAASAVRAVATSIPVPSPAVGTASAAERAVPAAGPAVSAAAEVPVVPVAAAAGVCRLLEDDIPTVAFWFDGWRHGVCRLLEGDMAYVAFPSRRPSRSLTEVTGVLCVSTALAVSGERDKMAVAFTFSNSEI